MTYAVLFPEIVLIASALLMLVLGFFTKRRPQVLWAIALVSVLVSLFATLDMMGLSVTHALGLNLWSSPLNASDGNFRDQLRLHVDLFALFFHTVFLVVALLVVIASKGFISKEEPHQAEYYCLMFFAVAGMMFVAAATDLIVLYLAFEMSGLSTFALTAFRKRDKKASEASMKFFVIGAISSAIILFGISLVYGITGTTSFGATMDLVTMGKSLGSAVPGMEPPLIVAIAFLLAGFGFKVAVVPFHMWAPDVYEGAPTTISAFLAAGSKKMGIVALIKVFLIALLAVQADWLIVLAVLAIATQTVGNLLAIPQKSVKRMLAYSSIAHAGYILIAIAVASILGTTAVGNADYAGKYDVATAGITGGLYHVLTHAIMTAGAFIVVAAVATAKIGESYEDYRGLLKRMPFMAIAMSILMLSLAGIPPFGGFFSKLVLFSSAVDASSYNAWFIALAISGVLNSALSLYFYARLVWYMLVLESDRKDQPPVSGSMTAAVAIAVMLVLIAGLAAQPFISFVQDAARSFLP